MSSAETAPKSPVFPIFLTAFLDMLGVGIIIPVIPALFFRPETSILSADFSVADKTVLYGWLCASYPIMQFFGAPILGALSDRFGRKPVLMVSLFGTLLGYLLFGWAILSQNLWLLFISRMLPGFFGGNISIVYSAIADIATPETKPKLFGMVGAAFGLGFIVGPALGGILADRSVVSWFDHATPFWFTAILTAVNILLVHFIFRETIKTRRLTPLNPLTGFRNLKRAFSSANLRVIFAVVGCISLGFTFFTQFYSVWLIQKFAVSEKELGLVFGWVGIWLVFTQAVTVRRLSKKFSPREILSWSIGCLAVVVGAVVFPQNFWLLLCLNPLIATFQGLSAPNLTTVVSESAAANEQGEILGINQSMISAGQAVPPIVAGYLASFDGRLPILTGGALILVGWMIFRFVFLKKK